MCYVKRIGFKSLSNVTAKLITSATVCLAWQSTMPCVVFMYCSHYLIQLEKNTILRISVNHTVYIIHIVSLCYFLCIFITYLNDISALEQKFTADICIVYRFWQFIWVLLQIEKTSTHLFFRLVLRRCNNNENEVSTDSDILKTRTKGYNRNNEMIITSTSTHAKKRKTRRNSEFIKCQWYYNELWKTWLEENSQCNKCTGTEFEEKLRAAVLSRTLEAFSMMISRNSKNMRKKNTQSYYHYLVCPASIKLWRGNWTASLKDSRALKKNFCQVWWPLEFM